MKNTNRRLAAFAAAFCALMLLAGFAAFCNVQDADAVGAPSSKLGCQKTGLNSWACDTMVDNVVIDAGSWQTVFSVTNPLPAFQTHEQMDITALVRFRAAPGGDASTMGGFRLHRFDGQYENGTFTAFAGGTADTELFTAGSNWLDSSVALVQCTGFGQTMCVQAFCERPCQLSLSNSYEINLPGDAGVSDVVVADVADSAVADSAVADAADSAVADAADSAPAAGMPLVLTPNTAPATLTNGTVRTTGSAFANGLGCGSGTPTVTVNGVAATGVTCSGTPGVPSWVNPAFSTASGSGSADETVVITTSSGACPSGCSSATIANSMHFFDTTNPVNLWIRGDSTSAGTAGGAVATWPALIGTYYDGGTIVLTQAGDGGVTTVAQNGIQAPLFGVGQWMQAGDGICNNAGNSGTYDAGSFGPITMEAVACDLNAVNVGIGSVVFNAQPSPQAYIGFSPTTYDAGFAGNVFNGAAYSTNVMLPDTCDSIGYSVDGVGNTTLVFNGVTTMASLGGPNSANTDFYVANYQQSNANGAGPAAGAQMVVMEEIVKCKVTDSAAEINNVLNPLRRVWNTK